MSFKIAIIDRGFDTQHRRLVNAEIEGINIHKSEEEFYLSNEIFDDDGHGTSVAGVIHKHCPDRTLVGVKLSSYNGIITLDLLCEGIKYCCEHNGVKIINISMGVACRQPSSELRNVIELAKQKGIFVVASAHNFPSNNCYPAHFPYVFGVACGLVSHKGEYQYLGEGLVNILAKGTVQRLAWKDNSFKISSGTSFAAAHFSGLLGNLINDQANITFDELLKIVKKHSSKDVEQLNYVAEDDNLFLKNENTSTSKENGNKFFSSSSKLNSVKSLALFPACEKEIQTIIEFKDLCPLNIPLIIDYPRGYNKKLQPGIKNYVTINRSLTEEEYSKFDTLVIGYFLDQPFDANIIFGMDLIKCCVRENKNFLIFDSNVYKYVKNKVKEQQSYKGKIFYPEVNLDIHKKLIDYNYLNNVKCPILMVLGTGSKQGKITTQLRVKSILEKSNYSVSYLATEPQAILMGADFLFPYGHKSTVKLGFEYWADFLRVVVNGIYEFNKPDIIITGGQGGILPKRAVYNVAGGNILKNLHFFLGVKPDAIICTIAPNDSIEFIQKNLQILSSFSEAPIIALALTPIQREIHGNSSNGIILNQKVLIPEEYEEIRTTIQDALNIPVINILSEDNEDFLLEQIQFTFSNETEPITR